jgi:wingless-type MMTV integration site family, member 8
LLLWTPTEVHTTVQIIMGRFTAVFLVFLSSRTALTFSPGWSLTNAMLASTHVSEADLALSHSVRAGAELAMRECANQFKNEVWDCPPAAFEKTGGLAIGGVGGGAGNNREPAEANRETAFVSAVLSAGVTQTISRNCSAGSLDSCGCEWDGPVMPPTASWKWAGCSDNLVVGAAVGRQFLDRAAGLPALHNYEAGRVAVRKAMRQLCKCHGVSGSCATQTCWRQLGDFRDVGAFLKRQYRAALRVDFSNGVMKRLQQQQAEQQQQQRGRATSLANNRVSRTSRDRRTSSSSSSEQPPAALAAPRIKKRTLVFLQQSPDYCRTIPALGHKGVAGRTCMADPNSPDPTKDIRKCGELCRSCGLAAKKQVVEVATSCNCRFEWCCKITCQTCHKKQIRITCVEPARFPSPADGVPDYDFSFLLSNAT